LSTGLARASFLNNSQTCTTQSRILAPRSRYAEVVDAVSQRVRSMVVGDPLDPKVEIGPMVSEQHRDRVLGYIDIARRSDARLITGGGRPAGFDRGWFVEPTIRRRPTPQRDRGARTGDAGQMCPRQRASATSLRAQSPRRRVCPVGLGELEGQYYVRRLSRHHPRLRLPSCALGGGHLDGPAAIEACDEAATTDVRLSSLSRGPVSHEDQFCARARGDRVRTVYAVSLVGSSARIGIFHSTAALVLRVVGAGAWRRR
jgi:Aldehyde dehydrogenase family